MLCLPSAQQDPKLLVDIPRRFRWRHFQDMKVNGTVEVITRAHSTFINNSRGELPVVARHLVSHKSAREVKKLSV